MPIAERGSGGDKHMINAHVNQRIAPILESSFSPEVACFNRDGFFYCLARELAESKRYGHFSGFIVFRMESVEPDEDVNRLVRVLSRNIRDTDYIGLLDRKTVGVILQHATIENTRMVLNRLRSEIETLGPIDHSFVGSASAVFPSEANTLESLQGLAEERLRIAVS